ncbi:MAG: phosphodiester glycosidase family protein [Acidimicrobiales bacterium]|nr:phosphodiester glycosidase family protein [Acidimicrobiales bacterium]
MRWTAVFVLVPILVWVGVSMGMTLTNPGYGSSLSARLAEWARQNHGGGIVNWVENEWYSHHPPPVGGKPQPGAIHRPKAAPKVVAAGPEHLPPPAAMTPQASPPIPGEGQWSPAGRSVQGIPSVYVTTLRPDAVHTSEVAGVAWLDTKLLRATLYSGSQIPGPGVYSHTAPVSATDATSLTAAFNAGFLMSQSNGGYYTDGRTIVPLVGGAASFVVYKDGTASVAQWGRDATLTPDVASVRQNLDLVVDQGQPVPGLNAADTSHWGFTLGNQVYVWRSGVGVTATGALVYVGGPGLNITDLANLLADAGAVRGMELDINTDWVNFASYGPPLGVAASPANGATLLPTMKGGPERYFQSWWSRDFITMSVR